MSLAAINSTENSVKTTVDKVEKYPAEVINDIKSDAAEVVTKVEQSL